MKLVVLITAKIEDGLEVAQAWQDAGAPGVTIVRTYGLYALQQQAQHGDIELPRVVVSMAMAMAHIIDSVEERGELILSLVEDTQVDTLINAANAVLGDLTDPGHGVLFVLPIERAMGVRDPRGDNP
jgi:nitrogen regulatory protein PII